MINPRVVAAIRVVGVRGDPCGAMQRIAPQRSQRTPATCIAGVGVGVLSIIEWKNAR